ncbi:MAG: OmpA family protein, partial [Phycisphaerae bacterium]|nr:OmpA family protein [Phycisphaerae bacterium]
MSDLHRHDDGGPPPVEPDPAGEDPRELDELRRLLIGGEREQLANLQDRVDNLGVEAAEVGSVLPEAIRHCGDQNGELANALAPTIEKSLTASVRKDPQPLADAIFPIIGPAIRKSISETLSRFVQSLNQALEHSISPKGIMWRVEAMRTGRSFAEVVLLRTLAYRVEQVFLIHRENGLLLQHVVATGVDAEDGDMVSGMLTAIEDFVGDSFQAGEGQGLDAMKVGELTVWIEFGPAAFLAAVIRGNAPLSLRPELQAAVESIHRRQAEDLAGFQGDASVFEASRPVLENCLKEARQEQAKGERKKPIIAWILIAAILLPLAWLGYRSFRDQRAWSAFLTDLAAEPGIVVTRSERDGRNLIVEGLRDPLATEPTTLLARSNIDSGRLTTRWAPYHSADPKLALRRVVALLQPPPAVDIRLTDGVLHLMGTADPPWSDRARVLA